MVQLFFIIHIFIGSTLAGMGVILALILGLDGLLPLLLGAGLGFALAFPVSWVVARRIVS